MPKWFTLNATSIYSKGARKLHFKQIRIEKKRFHFDLKKMGNVFNLNSIFAAEEVNEFNYVVIIIKNMKNLSSLSPYLIMIICRPILRQVLTKLNYIFYYYKNQANVSALILSLSFSLSLLNKMKNLS